MDEYLEKLVRYSYDWARQRRAAGSGCALWEVALRPPAAFLSAYVLRSGWRDGSLGFVLALLGAVSVATKYTALWTLSRSEASGESS
jgi:hypothetical protein